MGFVKATCPGCGANIDYDDSRDFGFCQYCGAKITRDKIIIEHKGTVNIGGVATVDSLVERAFIMLSQRKFTDADNNADRALDINPKYYRAYLVKLMCKTYSCTESDLAKYSAPLDSLSEFNIAYRFASESERAELDRYNSETKYANDRKEKEAKLSARHTPIYEVERRINSLNADREKCTETINKTRITAPIFTVLTIAAALFTLLMLYGAITDKFHFLFIVLFLVSGAITVGIYTLCADHYDAKKKIKDLDAEISKLSAEKRRLEADYNKYRSELGL